MIILRIPAEPAPKGSNRAMIFGGRAHIVPNSGTTNMRKQRAWTKAVCAALLAELRGRPLRWTGPVTLACVFAFQLRKGDLRRNGLVKPSTPTLLTVRPDGDKCLRLTADAVTQSGLVWKDDSQAVFLAARVYIPPGHPVESVLLIGTDLQAVTAMWQHEINQAGENMRRAKGAA